uniref:Thioesterase domain-containing protein n=1 Tax=Globisporangium ultimum (strain ATCC 200006 / CBS 805.95 / DAOM BR144) TaxID=431595 RepID=K3WEB7_GLOUD
MARKAVAFALLTCPPVAVALLSLLVFQTSRPVALTVGFLSAFMFCDMWYFLRMVAHSLSLLIHDMKVGRGAAQPDEPRRHLFAVSKLRGRILLNDIDRNGHCNNARYFRECGFGRRDLWQHNGIWAIVTANGGNLVVGSQTVRYRRELSFGEAYTLESRVLGWDDRAFYVEHRFVTQPKGKKFINAIIIVKNTVLGSLGPEKLVAKLPNLQGDEQVRPNTPSDVAAWIDSNNISSKLLRAESIK